MNIFDYISLAVKTLPMKGRRNALKILTLGAGLSVGLVLTSKVCFEQTFDDFYDGADRILCLREAAMINGEQRVFSSTPGGIAPKMKEFIPQVEEATRFTPIASGASLVLAENGRRIDAGYVIISDTSLFKVLDRECLAGNLGEPLGVEGEAVISSSLAEKCAAALTSGRRLSGREAAESVIGQKFELAGMGDLLTISGVYEDFPLNSSWHPSVVISLPTIGNYIYDGSDNMVGNDRYSSFLKIRKGADAAEVESRFPDFNEKYLPMEEIRAAGLSLEFRTMPLTEYHDADEPQKNTTLVLAFVAFALLMTSMLNYLLIVLSSAATRAREMALRKCLGSSRLDILEMMTAEAVVHTFLAAVLAGALIFAARSMIENVLGASVAALFTGRPLALSLTVLAVLVALNSIVPAVFFNRIPVATAFRNWRAGKRAWKLVLLAVEFGAVVFLAVVMGAISLQYRKMMGADLGFRYDNMAIVTMQEASGAQKNTLMHELRSLSYVDDACFAYQSPFEHYSGDNVSIPDDDRQLFNIRDAYYVDDHYFNVMGISIAEGSNFNPELGIDAEMVVDRSFAEAMKKTAGWDEVLGREVNVTAHRGPVRICGVIDDIHTGDFAAEDADFRQRPMGIFYCSPDIYAEWWFGYIFIKYHKISPEALRKTDELLKSTLDGQAYKLMPCGDVVAKNYESTLNARNAILAGGIMTLLIALAGLIGYTVDEVRRRSREIAVRRVNGASFGQIRSMFQRDVMAVALPSTAAGSVLAWFVAGRWEQNFSIQAGLPWWLFVVAIVAVLAVIAAVSDVYVLMTAGSNPADSIKTE